MGSKGITHSVRLSPVQAQRLEEMVQAGIYENTSNAIKSELLRAQEYDQFIPEILERLDKIEGILKLIYNQNK